MNWASVWYDVRVELSSKLKCDIIVYFVIRAVSRQTASRNWRQTQGGRLHVQTAGLVCIKVGSGECKLNSYVCVYLHPFTWVLGIKLSINLCLQWVAPETLFDAWPGPASSIWKTSEGFRLWSLPPARQTLHTKDFGDITLCCCCSRIFKII